MTYLQWISALYSQPHPRSYFSSFFRLFSEKSEYCSITHNATETEYWWTGQKLLSTIYFPTEGEVLPLNWNKTNPLLRDWTEADLKPLWGAVTVSYLRRARRGSPAALKSKEGQVTPGRALWGGAGADQRRCFSLQTYEPPLLWLRMLWFWWYSLDKGELGSFIENRKCL